MTHDFKQLFSAEYSFVGFVQATGLSSPRVSELYNKFREFAWDYVHTTQGPLSEAFEVWIKGTE